MERVIIIVMDLVAETIPSCEGGIHSTFLCLNQSKYNQIQKRNTYIQFLSIILIEFRI